MKTITLFTSLVLMCGTAKATPFLSHQITATCAAHITMGEPIIFRERGIAFYVFLNGDFDFNTRPDDVAGSYYYRKANTKDTARNSSPLNYGVLIAFDHLGRVRRVGNTFINYDSRDRVNRIGSVYMRYNRFALTQIGGLRIVYNPFGEIVDWIGSVKNNGFTNNYYSNPYSYNGEHNYNCTDHYYYRNTQTRETDVVDTKNKEEKESR